MVRKYPARQIPHSVAPSRDEKPGPRTSQDAHDDEPGAPVYLPASQASQSKAPSALNDPTSHVSHPDLSLEDFLPAVQDEHDDEPVASVYLPASQASQEAWPVVPCAEPEGQTVQVKEPGLEAKDPDEHDWHTIVASVGVKSPTGQALQLVAPVRT